VANWRALDALSGRAACGAAVKADGYGLGAVDIASRLARAGCRNFFVATWAEAEALQPLDLPVSVLHGIRSGDLTLAKADIARPVLSTPAQVALWKTSGGGACDVMVDTGMNRLGVSPDEIAQGLLDGLAIETLMSHLACADEDSPMNDIQRIALAALAGRTSARRMSLANSAGIALGPDYAFDLTRPGLALYGGIPRGELSGRIGQVATPEAQIIQRRRVHSGQTVGYNAAFTATAPVEVAILNIGYADGYWCGFSGRGAALVGGERLLVLGRISMDLTAIDVTAAPELVEGDWVAIDYALPTASAASGMSQYELLTGLGNRFDRVWA
ncbi:MAG: alanine racemase, partial [Sphingomonas sp.]